MRTATGVQNHVGQVPQPESSQEMIKGRNLNHPSLLPADNMTATDDARSHRAAIKIKLATRADLPVCAVCWGDRRSTYPSIYPLRLRNNSLPDSARLKRNVKDLQEELDDELAVFKVATRIEETSGIEQVAGYVIWQKPGTVEKEEIKLCSPRDDHLRAEKDPVQAECDTALATKLKEESIRVRRSYSEQGSLWWVFSRWPLSSSSC